MNPDNQDLTSPGKGRIIAYQVLNYHNNNNKESINPDCTCWVASIVYYICNNTEQ